MTSYSDRQSFRDDTAEMINRHRGLPHRDRAILHPRRWPINPRHGAIYDPAANTWTEKPLPMPKEIGRCPSGFYTPELNAHFVHVADDSADNGVMWVYRYK